MMTILFKLLRIACIQSNRDTVLRDSIVGISLVRITENMKLVPRSFSNDSIVLCRQSTKKPTKLYLKLSRISIDF